MQSKKHKNYKLQMHTNRTECEHTQIDHTQNSKLTDLFGKDALACRLEVHLPVSAKRIGVQRHIA